MYVYFSLLGLEGRKCGTNVLAALLGSCCQHHFEETRNAYETSGGDRQRRGERRNRQARRGVKALWLTFPRSPEATIIISKHVTLFKAAHHTEDTTGEILDAPKSYI